MQHVYFKKETVCSRNDNLAVSAKFIKAGLIGLSFLLFGGAAQGQTLASLPSASHPIASMGSAKPIQGWTKFCEGNPAECAVDRTEAATIEMTPQVWRTIVSINQRVNASVKAVTDADHWGVVDVWGFPEDGRGDCEDYQLLKRRMLADSGLPRRAMRMTVVIDELGEGHAVLVIRTNQGDYVLDNKTSSVLPWSRTGYVFVKRESQDTVGWVSLGGIASSPTTTANR